MISVFNFGQVTCARILSLLPHCLVVFVEILDILLMTTSINSMLLSNLFCAMIYCIVSIAPNFHFAGTKL